MCEGYFYMTKRLALDLMAWKVNQMIKMEKKNKILVA